MRLDAVDLALDHLGHALLDRLGRGAGIGRGDADLRRHDVGELRHRQGGDGEQAGDGDDRRDDEGQPRPADEQRRDGHGRYCLAWAGRCRCHGRRHRHAVADALLALDDDLLAGLQPVGHDQLAVAHDAGLDAAQLHHVLVVDDEEIGAGLVEGDRLLGHRHDRLRLARPRGRRGRSGRRSGGCPCCRRSRARSGRRSWDRP